MEKASFSRITIDEAEMRENKFYSKGYDLIDYIYIQERIHFPYRYVYHCSEDRLRPMLKMCNKELKHLDNKILAYLNDETKVFKNYKKEIYMIETRLKRIELLLIACMLNIEMHYAAPCDLEIKELIESFLSNPEVTEESRKSIITEENNIKSLDDMIKEFK